MPDFPVDAATWASLNRLLDEALDRPPTERRQWLEGLAPEYAALKPQLLALLAHAEERGRRSPRSTC
jgi:hypothetical protein